MNINEAAKSAAYQETSHIGMTKEQMLARIDLLSSEMDANDEENLAFQDEINTLYAKIDALKV